MDNSKNNIPQFHDAYYKVRNSLGIYSGLLLAAVFVGIEPHDESKPLLPQLNLKFSDEKFGDGVTLVLGFLVAYNLVRYFIEWKQSNESRRSLIYSKWDRVLTVAISILSIMMYFFHLMFINGLFDYYFVVLPFVIYTFVWWYGNRTQFDNLKDYIRKKPSNKKLAKWQLQQLILVLLVSIIAGWLTIQLPVGQGPTEGDPEKPPIGGGVGQIPPVK